MRTTSTVILMLAVSAVSVLPALLLATPAAEALTPTRAERQLVRLVNEERAARGLAPVRLRASLMRAARAHARQQARRGVLTHRSSNGDGTARRVVRYGYTRSGFSYWTAGENVARATRGSLFATPQGAVYLWMGSRVHRRVILHRLVRNIGVGMALSDDGRRYFTLDVGRRIR